MSKFDSNLYFPREMQPLLCTRVRGTIVANDPKAVLYSPRTLEPNESVVCHLGEVHLGKDCERELLTTAYYRWVQLNQ